MFLTIIFLNINSSYKYIISSNCAALSLVILLVRKRNLGWSTHDYYCTGVCSLKARVLAAHLKCQLKRQVKGARGMAQWFRALAPLSEDSGLVPSTLVVAHSHP